MSKITIQDIANMCNISKSSVSRYLNGGYVSEQNRQKIKEAIEQTGFETNFFAKRLKSKKSGLLGVVLPKMDSLVISTILMGINNVCEDNNYSILIKTSNFDTKKELQNINSLYNQGVDGIIVYSLDITQEHIELVNKISIPVVFINNNHKDLDCINIDDYTAGRLLAEYFYNNNHKDILFLGIVEKNKYIRPGRKIGFYEYYQENATDYKIRSLETDFSLRNAYDMGNDIINLKPSAVICGTEHITTALMIYLKQHNINIPEDISIGGFGDSDALSLLKPEVTTIKFDYEGLGKSATEYILNKIFNRSMDKNKISLPVFFKEGQSVKKIS